MADADYERLLKTLSNPHITLADRELDSDVSDWIDTQAPSLNLVIGQRGIPVGRLTLLTGPEAGGKSTTGVHLISETQERGGIPFLIDAERRFEKARAVKIGVDPEKLIYWGGGHLEEVLKTISKAVDDVRAAESDRLVLILWDSVAATPTERQLKGEYMPGEHSRLIGTYLREIHQKIARQRIALVIVNQFRARINMEAGPVFMRRSGPRETMIADGPLRYYSSLKLVCSNGGRLEGDDKDHPTGMKMKVSTRFNDGGKNTVSAPERTGIIPLLYDTGFDKAGSAFEAAVAGGLLTLPSGSSWWQYGDRKFQRNKWPEILAETDIAEKIAELPLAWKLK